MSINLATYGLISALAIGGAVAQQQYSQPAGPSDLGDSTEAVQSDPVEPSKGSPLDCTTLMTHHRDMLGALDTLDQQANTLLSQMKEAQSDSAKLTATMAVVEALVTQRKEMRERMSTVEHETIQFLLANGGKDVTSTCPMMTEWLQYGTDTNERNTNERNTEDQSGADDLELDRGNPQR